MSNSYEVKLEIFEGPLDLLLHLIQKDELEIDNIPIARILDQYMEYLRLMEMLDIDIAGEFLVMASTLMLIKSKTLLPQDANAEDEDELDPREELVKQLLEYRKFKEASHFFEDQEQHTKNLFSRGHDDRQTLGDKEVVYQVSLFDLMDAFQKVLVKKPSQVIREIIQEEVTLEERIADIIELVKTEKEVYFEQLFEGAYSKEYIVTTFLALLELIRLKEMCALQKETFGEIMICSAPQISNSEMTKGVDV